MGKLLKELPTLFKLSYQGWKEDHASRLAAALAYYTIFSLAPLLVIAIAVAGLLWQRDAVQESVLNQIGGLVGAQGQTFVAGLLESASHPAQGVLATIIGIITLLFGALGAFNELHNALNTVWEVEEEKVTGLWNSIKKLIIQRFLSFAMILGIGFLLLVSLIVSTGLSALGTWIGSVLPFQELILQIINLLISIVFITVLFALIFKYLPDAEIAWRDVWVGAFVTAVLFSLGKTLIGLYLGSSAVATTFGAAGSLVILLLWIYYSAQLLFFGAEFTQVYANRLGSRIVVEGHAQTNAEGLPTTQRESVRQSPTTKKVGKPAVQRQIIPVTASTHHMDERIEKENEQTGRFILGLMLTSFVTGIMSTVFGLKGAKKPHTHIEVESKKAE
jgi:membrane protein